MNGAREAMRSQNADAFIVIGYINIQKECGMATNQNKENGEQSASGPFPWLMLDNQLCFATYALSREIIGLYRPLLESLGITYTQYITLLVLWESGEVSMKELGERLLLDSGTLTPLLKKLVAMGLVNKERDTRDERSVRVKLTDAGWSLRDKVMEVPSKILCGTGMDVGDAIALRDRIKELVRDIREQSGK